MRYIPREKRVCACGCGGIFECRPKSKQRFLNYHWSRTELHRYNEETKKKLSFGKTGDKNPMKREEVRLKVSASLIGNVPWNKGKHLSEDHRKKLSESHMGNIPSQDTREKMSIARQGERHWNWMGGKKQEPYGHLFKQQLKEKVRVRDGFKCRVCGVPELELNFRLDIHHIDYNKKNNDISNLVSLCGSCHSKTNFHRNDWVSFFTSSVAEKA